jgi:hypothetical protein
VWPTSGPVYVTMHVIEYPRACAAKLGFVGIDGRACDPTFVWLSPMGLVMDEVEVWRGGERG